MLGALFRVIGLTVSGNRLSAIPPVVSNPPELIIGCALGTDSSAAFWAEFRGLCGCHLSPASFWRSYWRRRWGPAWPGLTGCRIPSAILATAPGGIAEMGITAKVLQLGVPLVTAAHVTRVIVLVTTTGTLFRLARLVAKKLGKS